MDGLLFLIIGPTGVGKNTIIAEILKKQENLAFLPSFTSRSMRENESEGSPYYFVDKQKFEEMICNDELMEWKFVHGNNYYGIGKKIVENALKSGNHLITDVEVLGAMDVIDFFPNNCVSVFIDASSQEELIKRIKNRGSWSEKDLQTRLERIELEKLYKDHFDYYVINNDLNNAVEDLRRIIHFEIDFIKYRRENKDILHYISQLIIRNHDHQILLIRQKSPVEDAKWLFPSTHVLKNETPIDSIFRILHILNQSINSESREIIENLSPICVNKNFKVNHHHYEITFELYLDAIKLENENFDFQWFNQEDIIKMVNREDNECLIKKLAIS